MSRFPAVLDLVFASEGGFSDRPLADDPGGATNMGITRATLAAHRGHPVTTADVARLTRREAAAIYKLRYWDAVRGDALPAGIDLVAFDGAVHSGPSRSVRFLQKAVGAKPDGKLGPVTLRLLLAADAGAVIEDALDRRLAFLMRLKNWSANPGWPVRISKVRREALAMIGRETGAAAATILPVNPASPLLPPRRPAQGAATTRAVLDAHRQLIPGGFAQSGVAVLFVRGYYSRSFGAAGNDRAVYDDAAFLITPDGVVPFNANADPTPARRGVATLKAGQSVLYVPGKHGVSRPGGGYPAFRQASDVTVMRDQIGEDRDDASRRFWINLHKGSTGSTSSLGCLTIAPSQWDEFRTRAYAALDEAGQARLPVVLLEYAGDAPPVVVPDEAIPLPPARPAEPPALAEASTDKASTDEEAEMADAPARPETVVVPPERIEILGPPPKDWYRSKGMWGVIGIFAAQTAADIAMLLLAPEWHPVVRQIEEQAVYCFAGLAGIGRLTAKTELR